MAKFVVPRRIFLVRYAFLDANQRVDHILRLLEQKKNVFISGGAGTGKTTIINQLKNKIDPIGTLITASTGIAATYINGLTLHSTFGVNPIAEHNLYAYGIMKEPIRQKLISCHTIIIDEISLVDPRVLDLLNYMAQRARKNKNPFGGISMIFVGDLFQLPPVTVLRSSSKRFCFEARCWKKTVNEIVDLQTSYRCRDEEFSNILEEIRFGRCSDKTFKLLSNSSQNDYNPDSRIFTYLCSLKENVNQLNAELLEKYPGSPRTFLARDNVNTPTFLSHLPNTLRLKIGSPVILLTNLDVKNGLSNGTQGIVTGFSLSTGYPIVCFHHHHHPQSIEILPIKSINYQRSRIHIREQIPLQLAWALSIHKSQGMTIKNVCLDASKVFEYGQLYVGLSRGTSLKTTIVKSFHPKFVKTHPIVLRYWESIENRKIPL